MPHLQTLTEYELVQSKGRPGRYGLLSFDLRPYDIWFQRRWQKRLNEVLEYLEGGPPPCAIPQNSRPCRPPEDHRSWDTRSRDWNKAKNLDTFKGFPSDHTLALLPRPLILPQGWRREYHHVAPWDVRSCLGTRAVFFIDPDEEATANQVRAEWHTPKTRATGGRQQERGLYQWILKQAPSSLRNIPDRELVAELLKGNQEAEVKLVQRFYRRLYRFLLGERHARQAVDTEDIIPLTFDAAKKDLHKFQWRSKLGTWIYSIGKNQAAKFYALDRQHETTYDHNNRFAFEYDETGSTKKVHGTAKRGRYVEVEDESDLKWDFAEDSDEQAQVNAAGPPGYLPSYRTSKRPNPEQNYLLAEKRMLVKRAISTLAPVQRKIIRHRYFDGGIMGEKHRDGLSFEEVGELMGKTENAIKAAHRRALDELYVTMKYDPYFADRLNRTKVESLEKTLTHERYLERLGGVDCLIHVAVESMKRAVDEFERLVASLPGVDEDEVEAPEVAVLAET